MLLRYKFFNNIVLILFLFFLTSQALPQNKHRIDSSKTTADSVKNNSFESSVGALEKIIVQELIKTNIEKRNKRLREEQFSKIYLKIDEVNRYFSGGLDTVKINATINIIQEGYSLSSDVITGLEYNLQTPRNLTTSLLIMKEVLNLLEKTDKQVNLRINDISKFRSSLDSLGSDTILYIFPKDSTLATEYFLSLSDLSKIYNPVDSALISSSKNFNDIHNKIGILGVKLNEGIGKIENIRSADEISFFSGNLVKRNFPYIWMPSEIYNSIGESFIYSTAKNLYVLIFYVVNHILLIVITLLLFIIFYFLTGKIRKYIKSSELIKSQFRNSALISKTFITTFFIFLNLIQFILPRPPFVFSGLLWAFSGLLLIIILRNVIARKVFISWIYLYLIFLFSLNSNLLLKNSLAERWFLLFISAISLVVIYLSFKNSYSFYKSKRWVKNIVIICTILFTISFFTNVAGYYSFTKLIINTCILLIYISILLLSTLMFIKEGLFLLIHYFKTSGNEKMAESLNNLKYTLSAILKYIFIISGIIHISRNFYFYDYFADGIFIILQTERTIGNFNFKLDSVLIFVVIILLSTFLSKIISLYSQSQTGGYIYGKTNEGKSEISNWLLLIRIALFTAGTLLAFASSGIPMDKLAIILGSLGVGIGLGLQGIVGNLFSGVILAFEKPVKIGDQIEIDGKFGIIKEIGIRSSKLETFEGSDVIIPNGDMLTKHVINWTKHNNRIREEFHLSIKQGTDLKKCKELLEKILSDNTNVEKLPEPLVLYNQTGGSNINFRILFWCDINRALQIKSEIIYLIQYELKKEGIEIFFS